mgnify:FL=1
MALGGEGEHAVNGFLGAQADVLGDGDLVAQVFEGGEGVLEGDGGHVGAAVAA